MCLPDDLMDFQPTTLVMLSELPAQKAQKKYKDIQMQLRYLLLSVNASGVCSPVIPQNILFVLLFKPYVYASFVHLSVVL